MISAEQTQTKVFRKIVWLADWNSLYRDQNSTETKFRGPQIDRGWKAVFYRIKARNMVSACQLELKRQVEKSLVPTLFNKVALDEAKTANKYDLFWGE